MFSDKKSHRRKENNKMAIMRVNELKKPELNWIGKSTNNTHGVVSDADVSFTIGVYRDNDVRGTFYFRNEYVDLFDRINIAIYKNRVYFQNAENGWKVSRQKRLSGNGLSATSHSQFKITEDLKELKNFEGNYKLEYDDIMELYFIRKEVEKPRAYIHGQGFVN